MFKLRLDPKRWQKETAAPSARSKPRAAACLAPPALDLLDKDATDRRERAWLCSKEEPELERNSQDPLTQRHVRSDDVVHQVCGGVRHTPGVARGADPAELAGEGQEELIATRLADRAGEAMRVQTALEIAPEFILHVLRQALARTLVSVLEEALQVLLDDTVESGVLGRRCWYLFCSASGTAPALQRLVCRCRRVPNSRGLS
jgi:hypothetical protein